MRDTRHSCLHEHCNTSAFHLHEPSISHVQHTTRSLQVMASLWSGHTIIEEAYVHQIVSSTVPESLVPDKKSRYVPHTTQSSTANEEEPRSGSKSD